jgi:nucleoside-diphosphate-sugar epimerase
MNILITGVHGFAGSNLVTAMDGSHAVYGLDIVAAGVVKSYNWNNLINKNCTKETLKEMYAKLVNGVLKQ